MLFGVAGVVTFTLGSVRASTLTVTTAEPPAVFTAPLVPPSILASPTPSVAAVAPTLAPTSTSPPSASAPAAKPDDLPAVSPSPTPSLEVPSATPSPTPAAATLPAPCVEGEIQTAVLEELNLPRTSLCLSDLKVKDASSGEDIKWQVATLDATDGHPAKVALFQDPSGSQSAPLLADPRPFTLEALSSSGDEVVVAHFTGAETAAVVTAELIAKPPADHDRWVVIWE